MKAYVAILSAVYLALGFAGGYFLRYSREELIIKESVRRGWDGGVRFAVEKAYRKKLLLAPDPTAASFDGCLFVRVLVEAPLLEVRTDKDCKWPNVTVKNSQFNGGWIQAASPLIEFK